MLYIGKCVCTSIGIIPHRTFSGDRINRLASTIRMKFGAIYPVEAELIFVIWFSFPFGDKQQYVLTKKKRAVSSTGIPVPVITACYHKGQKHEVDYCGGKKSRKSAGRHGRATRRKEAQSRQRRSR